MHVLVQIIIAALSVLGFYFCVKTLASLIFTSKHITAAVVIENKNQLLELDLLLAEASGALFTIRRKSLAVFVPKDVWNACGEREKELARGEIERFGAKLCFIRPADS